MNIKTILLLYNRPYHTKKVLESLRINRANQIFVFIDGAKNRQDILNQKKIFKILDSYKDIINNIIIRDKNIGLASNMLRSIDYIFNIKADGIIVLEDDCVLKKVDIIILRQVLIILRMKKTLRVYAAIELGIIAIYIKTTVHLF